MEELKKIKELKNFEITKKDLGSIVGGVWEYCIVMTGVNGGHQEVEDSVRDSKDPAQQ